jgi:glycosyltransferase involved in cell wall biosynthesis
MREPLRTAWTVVCHITTVPMSFVFLSGQGRYLRARGLTLMGISSPGEELHAFRRTDGVRVREVEMSRRITPFQDLKAVRTLVKILRHEKPVIVHAHTPKGGLLGMISATFARVPVRIYHMRGLPLMGATGLKRVLLRWTERVSCRLAHRVLCVSHSLREAALDERLCSPARIAVLGSGSGQGVDASFRFDPDRLGGGARAEGRARLGIPADADVIGFVGRLVRDKGIVELADAWRSLRVAHPGAHLLMVGPWESQDPVPGEISDRLAADPRVHLVGPDWNTPPLYATMDVVTLPSYREGFPNVPLEAAAMRLPVVATRVAGSVDAVQDGVTGTLVPARDADALASAIEEYLRDPQLRKRHGEAGRRRVVREFKQEVIWAAIHDEYRRLMASRGIPVPCAPDGEIVAPNQTGGTGGGARQDAALRGTPAAE